MSVVAVLLGFSMFLAAGFLIAFLWAVRNGQYDDRHTPSIRMLFDDPPADPPGPKTPSRSQESS
jgi:cbb3-type cytochrome oxidase maturation protein